MYNAPRKEVELLCDNGVMDAIIDQFGPDVHTYAGDLQNFRVIEEVAVGKVFFNWIFGFEGKVRIKAPADVKSSTGRWWRMRRRCYNLQEDSHDRRK